MSIFAFNTTNGSAPQAGLALGKDGEAIFIMGGRDENKIVRQLLQLLGGIPKTT